MNDKFKNILPGEGSASAEKASQESATTLNRPPMLVIERIADANVVDELARFNLALADDQCEMPLLATKYDHCVIAAQQLKFSKTLPIDDDARYDIWCHWLRQFDRIPGTPEKTESLWDSYREPGNNRFMCDIFAQYKALNGMDNGTTMQLAPMPYQVEALRRIASLGGGRMVMTEFESHHAKPTPAERLEAERLESMSIQELIKVGSLTPRLAQNRLSRHPALAALICESAPLVEDELKNHTESLQALQSIVHGLNRHAGWWTDLTTGEPAVRNDGELLMLMVSELSEAMEAHRKSQMDDKLPHRKGVEVELADCLIRILDYCGGRGLDLAGAMIEKLAYNSVREDHTVAHRSGEHGKKY